MRIVSAILAITVSSSPLALSAGQANQAPRTTTGNTAPATATSAPMAPAAPSSILQPSLDTVQQTLTGLRVEKWKRGTVRDEASEDINSIVTDLQQRVPGLLKDADAAPGALSKTLPVSRHVDALYDVLLRVVEAARMAAPDDQANELRSALENLEKARLALDDSMESAAGSQEKQLVDLRVTVQKQAAYKCPAPPPPVCPKPETKKPVRHRAKSKATEKTPEKAPGSGAPQKPAATKPGTTTPNQPH